MRLKMYHQCHWTVQQGTYDYSTWSS